MTDLHVTDDDLFGRIHDLVTARMGGELTAEQFTGFERLLGEDAGARRLYVQYMYETVALPSLVGPQPEGKGARTLLPERPEGCCAQNVPDPFSLVRWTREYFSQPVPFSMLTAAIFMVCVVAILEILPAPTYTPIQLGNNTSANSSTNSPGRQPRDVPKKLNLVARITALHNCRWSPEGRAPIGYDYLGIGRELKLDSGLLKITYKTGAKIVLEGPVEFKVEKPNACRLEVGKLAANVPELASGFTVETPSATVVDLGTEFGVSADRHGDTEVHVLQGIVEMTVDTGRNGVRRTIRLGKNQSVQVDAKSKEVSTITSADGRFVQRLLSPIIPIEVFNTGMNVYEGQPDPHWQIAALSYDPDFQPQPAVVIWPVCSWEANDPTRSQWISLDDKGDLPGDGIYTFRTTFDLSGFDPQTAVLTGRFIVDNQVAAIRLNGRDVPVPRHSPRIFDKFTTFRVSQGFVDGPNTLEFVVTNAFPPDRPSSMGLRVELCGTARRKSGNKPQTLQKGGTM